MSGDRTTACIAEQNLTVSQFHLASTYKNARSPSANTQSLTQNGIYSHTSPSVSLKAKFVFCQNVYGKSVRKRVICIKNSSGETEYNVKQLVQGISDGKLTENGIKQVKFSTQILCE